MDSFLFLGKLLYNDICVWIYIIWFLIKSLNHQNLFLLQFRYSSMHDKCLMIFGVFITFFATWPIPALNLIYGQFVNTLVDYEALYSGSKNGSNSVVQDDDTQNNGQVPLMDSFCDYRVKPNEYV